MPTSSSHYLEGFQQGRKIEEGFADAHDHAAVEGAEGATAGELGDDLGGC